jgi:hypothetical protein
MTRKVGNDEAAPLLAVRWFGGPRRLTSRLTEPWSALMMLQAHARRSTRPHQAVVEGLT